MPRFSKKLPDDPTIGDVEDQTRSRSWWISGIFLFIIVAMFVFVGISFMVQGQ